MSSNREKTWVEIDSQAYAHNIQIIKSLLAPEVTFCSVIKANAYGHGIEKMTMLGIRSGIRCFGVDSIDEVEKVRRIAQQEAILILGYTPEDRLCDVVRLGAIQTVYEEKTVENLALESIKQQCPCFVNVKCETGTQRQGIGERDFKHLLASIEKTHGAVELWGLSSHFSSSEDPQRFDVTKSQNQKFTYFIEECQRFNLSPKQISISCSASTILYPETHLSMVRIGISQYGFWPSSELKELFTKTRPTFQLKPILSWKTRIAQIKDIKSGTPVGYDQKYISDRPIRIAILPVGYYDGFVRNLSNMGYVLVKGQKCAILGNVCMNMCIINVSSVPQIQIGDEVNIFGRDGMHLIGAEDHAKWTNTVHYEVLTRIGQHIKRIIV